MNVKDTPANTQRLVQVLDYLHSNMQTATKIITWTSNKCTHQHITHFIGLAAQFAILPYVRAKFPKKGKQLGTVTRQLLLLESAIFGWDCFLIEMISEFKYQESFAGVSRLELIEFLFDFGADMSCHTGSQISKKVERRYGPHNEYGNAVLERLRKTRSSSRASRKF